jgi:sensor histidine kinase regulating citrate/malate metabolism
VLLLNDSLEVQQVNAAAQKLLNIRYASDILGDQVIRILEPAPFMEVLRTGRSVREKRIYLAEYDKTVEQTIVYDREYHQLICIMRDVTEAERDREQKESLNRQTAEVADRVVEKQMRIVQQIASLLGETAAETKIALTKLKESIHE